MQPSNYAPKDAEEYLSALDQFKPICAQWAHGEVTGANAGEVRDLIGKIDGLAKSAEKDRKAIKEPYLEQGRKIDASFKPVAERADSLMKPLKAMLSAFLAAEEKRKREEAEKARREAEEKARLAEAMKEDAFVGEHVAEEAKHAEQAAAQAARLAEHNAVKGAESDRAMGLRTYRRARIVNAAMLVGHYANHPDVLAVCEKLANAEIRAAKGGDVSIPGIAIEEEKRVA